MFESNVSLPSLVRPQPFKAKRVSSYDQTGGNDDAWLIAAGETRTLAEIDGPGLVSHFWCTIASRDQHYLRKVVLKVYWDGETEPSYPARRSATSSGLAMRLILSISAPLSAHPATKKVFRPTGWR